MPPGAVAADCLGDVGTGLSIVIVEVASIGFVGLAAAESVDRSAESVTGGRPESRPAGGFRTLTPGLVSVSQSSADGLRAGILGASISILDGSINPAASAALNRSRFRR